MASEEKTVIEDDEKTILESSVSISESSGLKTFNEYTVMTQLPSLGSEADLYIIDKNDKKFVLKLYRLGIIPKEEVQKKIFELSSKYPEYLVRIIESKFHEKEKRWYEIQEYLENASMKEFKPDKKDLKRIIVNLTEGLKVIHDNNLLHLDLKPGNILVRKTEPIELVFTDFGISSLLDPELSRKLTQVKGTPLYWAPESFTGVVGKEADYWSLGMIILEILTGKHPFSGIEQRIIMYTLSTTGVEISESIEPDYKMLLKGLLTRDPKQRWGYEQVKRWLSGDRDIQLHYHNNEEKPVKKRYSHPYSFQGEYYYSFYDLARAFVIDEKSWNNAKLEVEKGNLLKWLDENTPDGNIKNDSDSDLKILKILLGNFRKESDSDIKVLKFVYTFNTDLPFIFLGKVITLKNLYLFLAKSLKRESTEGENVINNYLSKSLLTKYNEEYSDLTGKRDESLSLFLKTLEKSNSIEKEKLAFQILEIIFNKEKYLLPDNYNETEFIEFVTLNFEYIYSKNEMNNLLNDYYFPVDIVQKLKKPGFLNFINLFKDIKNLQTNNLLMRKAELEELQKGFVLPKDIIWDIQSGNYNQYQDSVKKLRNLQSDNLLITPKDLDKLIKSDYFYLPEKLIDKSFENNYQLYVTTVQKLRELEKNAFLIKSKEVTKILNTYILPENIVKVLKEKDYINFLDSIKDFRTLENDKVLITVNDFNKYSAKYPNDAKLFEINGNIFESDNYKKYRKASNYIKSKIDLTTFINDLESLAEGNDPLLNSQQTLQSYIKLLNSGYIEFNNTDIEIIHKIKRITSEKFEIIGTVTGTLSAVLGGLLAISILHIDLVTAIDIFTFNISETPTTGILGIIYLLIILAGLCSALYVAFFGPIGKYLMSLFRKLNLILTLPIMLMLIMGCIFAGISAGGLAGNLAGANLGIIILSRIGAIIEGVFSGAIIGKRFGAGMFKTYLIKRIYKKYKNRIDVFNNNDTTTKEMVETKPSNRIKTYFKNLFQ